MLAVARLSDVANPDERRLARLRSGPGAVAAKVYKAVTKRIGGAALVGFLDANRPGDDRPPFEIPTELRQKLPGGPRSFALRRPRARSHRR